MKKDLNRYSLTYNFDVLSSFSLISLHRNTRIYTGVPVNFVFATENFVFMAMERA